MVEPRGRGGGSRRPTSTAILSGEPVEPHVRAVAGGEPSTKKDNQQIKVAPVAEDGSTGAFGEQGCLGAGEMGAPTQSRANGLDNTATPPAARKRKLTSGQYARQ